MRGRAGTSVGFLVAAGVQLGALVIAVLLWESIGTTPLMLVLGGIVMTIPVSIVVATSSSPARRLGLGLAAGSCLVILLFISWIVVALVDLSVNGPT